MGKPLFKLKLCYPDGSEILFKGAGKFERDMTSAVTSAVVARILDKFPTAVATRGIGFWRTEAHVVQDVKDTIRETLPSVVEESVAHVLLSLKEETVALVR